MNIPIIQNVISIAKLNNKQFLELKLIASRIQGCRYNPKRFPAVVIRKTKPKGTILVFKSGKFIIVGTKSQTQAELTARKIVKDIKKVTSFNYQLTDFKVTNIVANGYLGYELNLQSLADNDLFYKDDNFSGVVYRMGQPVKTALIFHTGKVVLTGVKDRISIEKAFNILKLNLEKYAKEKLLSDTQSCNNC